MSKTMGKLSPSRRTRDEAGKLSPVSPPSELVVVQTSKQGPHRSHRAPRWPSHTPHSILFDVSSVKTSHTLTSVIEDGGNFYQDLPTRTNPLKTGIHTEKLVESKSVPGSQTPRPPQCEECYSYQSARHL
jgi:hypothetical protein